MKSRLISIILISLFCFVGCGPRYEIVDPYEGISDIPASKDGWSHDCEEFLTIEQSIYDDCDRTLASGTCSNCGRILAYVDGILQEDTEVVLMKIKDFIEGDKIDKWAEEILRYEQDFEENESLDHDCTESVEFLEKLYMSSETGIHQQAECQKCGRILPYLNGEYIMDIKERGEFTEYFTEDDISSTDTESTETVEETVDTKFLEVLLFNSLRNVDNIYFQRIIEYAGKPTNFNGLEEYYTEEQIDNDIQVTSFQHVTITPDVTSIDDTFTTISMGEESTVMYVTYEDKVNNLCYKSNNGVDGYKEALEETTAIPVLVPLNSLENYTLEEDLVNFYITGEFDLQSLFGKSADDFGVDLTGKSIVRVMISKDTRRMTGAMLIIDDYSVFDNTNTTALSMELREVEGNNFVVLIPSKYLEYEFKN